MKTILIAGAGIAGLAASIRLSREGFRVVVFEQSNNAGGKLNELQMKGFRFDTGPSLFTMPWYLDELTDEHFKLDYEKIPVICHYFFPDNTRFQVNSDINRFVQEASSFFNVSPQRLQKFLRKNEVIYRITSPVFLEKAFTKHQLMFVKMA